MCCYAAHRKSVISQKKVNCWRVGVSTATAGVSVCLLRHGKRNFRYYLAVQRKTCCGVFICCYPDCWIEVVTHRKVLRPAGRPSRHRLDFLVFICLQADTQTVPNIPSCYCTLLTNFFFSIWSHRINARTCNGYQITFFLFNRITSKHEIIMPSASSLIRHQMLELQSMAILTQSSLTVATAPTLTIHYSSLFLYQFKIWTVTTEAIRLELQNVRQH